MYKTHLLKTLIPNTQRTQNTTIKKQILVKKWAKVPKRHLTKQDAQMTIVICQEAHDLISLVNCNLK